MIKTIKKSHHSQASSTEIGDEVHACANCGHEYKGHYCPACGQKAKAGRITWETVRCGVMDVWGMGSRSLFRSLWNLIVRPGCFISDYINGKWQSSFPPVKMLVIVAVSLYFLGQLFCPEIWNNMFDKETESAASGTLGFIDTVIDWFFSHPEWSFLFLLSFLIVPTWFVFRHAPRNTRHTLPQGFFIQVFMSVQFYLWLFVFSFVFKLCGLGLDLLITFSFVMILPLIVFVDYKWLFGYGWWGTLWRVIVIFQLMYLGGALLVFLSVSFDQLILSSGGGISVPKLVVILFSVIALIMLFLSVIDMVNRRNWRTVGWLKALKYPLIMLGVVLCLLIVGELIESGSVFEILRLLYFG